MREEEGGGGVSMAPRRGTAFPTTRVRILALTVPRRLRQLPSAGKWLREELGAPYYTITLHPSLPLLALGRPGAWAEACLPALHRPRTPHLPPLRAGAGPEPLGAPAVDARAQGGAAQRPATAQRSGAQRSRGGVGSCHGQRGPGARLSLIHI